MTSICVYGTVFNNVNTVEDSIKSVWSPDYDIVIVDNYSKDGTWEKLQELKKEYNLKLYRLKSSRGRGRAYALEQCPENSTTAYFDLDVMYNQNFHKAIKSGLKELFIFGPVMSYINSKEDILKTGNWRDLNFGEDIEFLSRQNISITFPLIIGKNEDVATKNLYIEREKRYSNFWKIRVLKNIIDQYRGWGISFSDIQIIYPYTKKYRAILILLYFISVVIGKYKNAYPNNYIYFIKKALSTIVDPKLYIKDINFHEGQIVLSRNIYNLLVKYNIKNYDNKLIKIE
ncbi:glycosyltransferase family 2 protein [Saccharolobus islandicus]|uniref:Glycosyl transferase family 2 n=1 Tax=Saccharolobus islandicus (strain M.16.4 / Kamchatka \|nr:glycosyltransferase family 2 protein [Sulfolobus islandicus]ACR41590.1 glycosyl transferase family 2 [Sulfolobus islandicus M.16.4]